MQALIFCYFWIKPKVRAPSAAVDLYRFFIGSRGKPERKAKTSPSPSCRRGAPIHSYKTKITPSSPHTTFPPPLQTPQKIPYNTL